MNQNVKWKTILNVTTSQTVIIILAKINIFIAILILFFATSGCLISYLEVSLEILNNVEISLAKQSGGGTADQTAPREGMDRWPFVLEPFEIVAKAGSPRDILILHISTYELKSIHTTEHRVKNENVLWEFMDWPIEEETPSLGDLCVLWCTWGK